MWTNAKKTQVSPQKRAYTWMKHRKSEVPPQKRPNMWMNAVNSGCSHYKEAGASANKKSSRFFIVTAS